MKLYHVPNSSRIKVVDNRVDVPPANDVVVKEDILEFHRPDGMYGICYNSEGHRVYIGMTTEVEEIT